MATTHTDNGRLDLSDFTFVIPFRLDSADRKRNLRIVVDHLLDHFDTQIIVSEHDQESRFAGARRKAWGDAVRHVFTRAEDRYFHRSECVNRGAEEVETTSFVIQDADAFIPAAQYLSAARNLRLGRSTIAFPYENRVMWVPNGAVEEIAASPPFERLASEQPYRVSSDGDEIVSLAVMTRTDAFAEMGMMSEHFKAWGYEDVEFFERAETLSYRWSNVEGYVYHLGHARGEHWGAGHPYFDDNRQEYERVCAMQADELRAYVDTWPWSTQRKLVA